MDKIHPEKQVVAQAGLLHRSGRDPEALQLLGEHASHAAVRWRLIDRLLAVGRHDEAAAVIRKHGVGTPVEQGILAHLARDYPAAVSAYREGVASGEGRAIAHHHLGRALFNQGDTEAARESIRAALVESPGYPEAWQSLAHVLRFARDIEGAMSAYREALVLAPGLAEAALSLAGLELVRGHPEQALTRLEGVLVRAPGRSDARLLKGQCLQLLRRYGEAIVDYRHALDSAQDPRQRVEIMASIARAHSEAGETGPAAEWLRSAIHLNPTVEILHVELASLYERSNHLDDAQAAVSAGLQHFPSSAALQFESARLLRRRGDFDGALSRMRSIPADTLPGHMQPWFKHELGIQLDRVGRYAEAMTAVESANRMAARGARALATDRTALDRMLDAMQAWLEGAPATPAGGIDLGGDLCFLIGFPRSGTTLLDLMLDGHERVVSIEEQSTIEPIMHAVDRLQGGFPRGLEQADVAAQRRRYRELLHRLGVRDAPGRLLLDKMPIRTAFAYFIHQLFPEARFLFALRHPCDVVLSNFFQLYAVNEIFIHFDSLAESARVYARVMDLWESTAARIPADLCHVVRYEWLVEDPGAELREVCRFLGLPFDPALIDHRSGLQHREVRTNSYQQVAEPLHVRSMGRWQNYREAMAPCLPLLRHHIERFGYRT